VNERQQSVVQALDLGSQFGIFFSSVMKAMLAGAK